MITEFIFDHKNIVVRYVPGALNKLSSASKEPMREVLFSHFPKDGISEAGNTCVMCPRQDGVRVGFVLRPSSPQTSVLSLPSASRAVALKVSSHQEAL